MFLVTNENMGLCLYMYFMSAACIVAWHIIMSCLSQNGLLGRVDPSLSDAIAYFETWENLWKFKKVYFAWLNLVSKKTEKLKNYFSLKIINWN